MKIEKTAIAGTLESSDAQVEIEPKSEGIDISLTSTVMNQYGRQIKELIYDELSTLNVDSCSISVNDHGALDCTLRARIDAAVYRAAGQFDNIPWEALEK